MNQWLKHRNQSPTIGQTEKISKVPGINNSFFVGFFQFFATEKVNNSNSAHIRTQILHTPGIIWNLYAHNLVRNNFIYYIVFCGFV